MGLSLRSKILANVVEVLREIHGQAPYETRVDRVLDGYRDAPDVRACLAVVAGDTSIIEASKAGGPRKFRFVLPVQIWAIVKAHKDVIRDQSDGLRADIEKALMADRRRGQPDAATNTELVSQGPDQIDPPQGEQAINQFVSLYQLSWSRDEGTP